MKVNTDEYAPHFGNYIDLVANKNLQTALEDSLAEIHQFFASFNKDLEYTYEDGKWTLREVLQHIIDTEIVFIGRALKLARNEQLELPGFDHKAYAKASGESPQSLESLKAGMLSVRLLTLWLFNSFSESQLQRIGVVSGNNLSVRAIGFIISGHQKHHLNIIEEKYT